MTSSYFINFNHLPNELKTLIFSFLEKPTRGDIGDLGNAALVCRQWRNLAENPDFWDEVGLIITLKGRSQKNCFFLGIFSKLLDLARVHLGIRMSFLAKKKSGF